MLWVFLVHSSTFCSPISAPKWVATRFGALRDIWVAVGPHWQCLLWRGHVQLHDAPLTTGLTVTRYITRILPMDTHCFKQRRFSSVLWKIMNRFMLLLNNWSCMRWNNFQLLFLVYLPVFKKVFNQKKSIAQRKDLIVTTFSLLQLECIKLHFTLWCWSNFWVLVQILW